VKKTIFAIRIKLEVLLKSSIEKEKVFQNGRYQVDLFLKTM